MLDRHKRTTSGPCYTVYERVHRVIGNIERLNEHIFAWLNIGRVANDHVSKFFYTGIEHKTHLSKVEIIRDYTAKRSCQFGAGPIMSVQVYCD